MGSKELKKKLVSKELSLDPNLPAANAFYSRQIDLFQSFLCNTKEEKDKLSNTIDLWDSIPKYCVSQQAMNGLRTKEGFLPGLEKSFIYQGNEYKIRITAALIVTEDGDEKAFYPSANEELVEDALRKIAAEHQQGFFNNADYTSGTVFTIHLLRTELSKRGHTRSYYEIVKSLKILSGSHIEIILPSGKGFAKTSFLPSLTAVSRHNLNDDPTAKWFAHFHPLVTQCIDTLRFRQYNYHQMMSHSTQLSRWLHKKLSHNYTNASLFIPYQIWLSTVRRDSGMLEYKRSGDGLRKLEQAFTELKDNNVLLSFAREEEIRGERNKIIDIKFSLTPHQEFIKSIKAANKRYSDNLSTTN